jgi:hypothetical protein
LIDTNQLIILRPSDATDPNAPVSSHIYRAKAIPPSTAPPTIPALTPNPLAALSVEVDVAAAEAELAAELIDDEALAAAPLADASAELAAAEADPAALEAAADAVEAALETELAADEESTAPETPPTMASGALLLLVSAAADLYWSSVLSELVMLIWSWPREG